MQVDAAPSVVAHVPSMTPGSDRVYVVQLGYRHHCDCPAFANRQLGTWAGKERYPHCKHIDEALNNQQVSDLMWDWEKVDEDPKGPTDIVDALADAFQAGIRVGQKFS